MVIFAEDVAETNLFVPLRKFAVRPSQVVLVSE